MHLDALRALAVLGVLASHFLHDSVVWTRFGPQGVRLFFVLSGFLITGILLRCRVAVDSGRQSVAFTMRQFYARRFLRIFPLYYATLAVLWLADVAAVRQTIAWHASYLSNVLFAVTESWHGPVAHFWSLAIEEQFYLLWPAVVLLVPRRHLRMVVVLCIASAPAWRFVTSLLGVSDMVRWMMPPVALDSLGIGSLLAMAAMPAHGAPAQERPASVSSARPRCPRWLAWAAAVAVPGAPTFYVLNATSVAGASPFAVRAMAGALFDVATSVIFAYSVWYAASSPTGPLARVLAWRPLTYVGRISYGVYVIHNFMPLLVPAVLAVVGLPYPSTTGAQFVLLTAATIVLAAASWHAFERPINEQKRRFPYVQRAPRREDRAAVG